MLHLSQNAIPSMWKWLLLPLALQPLQSTALRLRRPLGHDHVGQKNPSEPTELSSPHRRPPDDSTDPAPVVFRSITAARTPKHVWAPWKGQIHQTSPGPRQMSPVLTRLSGGTTLKRNGTKQIHVNNLFPHLMLLLDFWEEAQEGFFQAQTRSMHLLPQFCLNMVSRPWSAIIYATVTVIKECCVQGSERGAALDLSQKSVALREYDPKIKKM